MPATASRFLTHGDQGSSGPRGLMSGLVSCARRAGIENAVKEFRAQSARFGALAALPPDSQRIIDEAVIRVGVEKLVLVNDLLASPSLRRDLPNWLSVMELGYDSVGETGHAQRTMVPKARGERQEFDRKRAVIPVFCTWDDFSFDIRKVLHAERVGIPLETDHVEQATRNDNEAIEDQAWNGAGFAVHGNSAPGVLTSPSNTIVHLDWTTQTGEVIRGYVNAMIDMAVDDGYDTGPYNLYIPRRYASHLNNDYKAAGDMSIRERIAEIDTPGGPVNIRTTNRIGTNRTALIQMTNNVIDVIVGQEPTPISWTDGPEMEFFWIVLACMIVRIKNDYNGKAGIVVGNV